MQNKDTKFICNFLRNRPALSVNKIEQELTLPHSTIAQALTGRRNIPSKYIAHIVEYLTMYGLMVES